MKLKITRFDLLQGVALAVAFVITVLMMPSCAVPTNEGGDNAPDVEEVPMPDAATAMKDREWEARSLLECDRACNFYQRLGCAATSSPAWHADCRQRCYTITYNYPDCQMRHATVNMCRYTVGWWVMPSYMSGPGDGDQYICWGEWPYLTRPQPPNIRAGCDLAQDALEWCVSRSGS
jgi:hypothetical protein